MNKLKRFSQAEIEAYVRDHYIKPERDVYIPSEPHTVVKAVKKRRNRGYRGPATHFEVQRVVGSKLTIMFDCDICNPDNLSVSMKLSEGMKKRGIKLHVYEDWEPKYNRIWFKTRKEAGKALTYMTRLLNDDYAVIKCYDENC